MICQRWRKFVRKLTGFRLLANMEGVLVEIVAEYWLFLEAEAVQYVRCNMKDGHGVELWL